MPPQGQAIADGQLYESGRTFVYRSDRLINGQAVILKTLKEIYTDAENLAWFRREYEIIRRLNGAGAVRAYDFWDDCGGTESHCPTLVLEDFGGESLTHLKLAGWLKTKDFLELAIAIAECLGQIHGAGIIHKDINPSNIVLNPETQQVKLIDFGISTARSREITTFGNANTLEGTLAYISPEQTGRMNRAIDDRSDLYSLGVTFYELLTGRLPFDNPDPVELIHCHIAKMPPVLGGRNGIPDILSEIVMKLMAKNAEDRYQSAYGLKADLEICRQQWQTNQQIERFSLARDDRGDRLQIPQKLYGRDAEILALLQAFTGGIHRQKPVLCLVKGYSGIGKSALIAEIYKPITVRHGFFIAGKFDQLRRDTPYSAIADAFRVLIRQLLAEPERELQQWRERLQTALGNNGGAIAEIVPELTLIIGEQPELPPLGATESQYRFNLTLQNFIRAFTYHDRPLTLFLDDLQWADSASLQLLQLLMTAPETGYFFAIGAYRNNEVDAAHPLMLVLQNIRAGGVEITEIDLKPLPFGEIEKLVIETLCCSPDRGKSLAELLHVKTGGNPFFLNEFFKALYREELLHFNPQIREWQWDIEEIRKREMTANVVELLAGNIQKLPLAVRHILEVAACIGNRFELLALSEIAQKSPAKTAIALQVAIDAGLVFPLDKNYKLIEAKISTNERVPFKFAHDRIQQAAYSLLPDWEKRRIHLLLGRQLLATTPRTERGEKIFEIVNQFNLARQYIVKSRERDELARLNLEAGKKAKAAAAWQAAIAYLKIGIEFLPRRSWQEAYPLTLALHTEAVEAAYLCSDFERMNQWAQLVWQQGRSVLDKVRVCETQILSYAAKSQPQQAINIALKILTLLGIKFPQKPNKLHLLLALVKLKIALANKNPRDLIHLPAMKSPIKLAALRILAGVLSSAYFTSPELFGLIALKQVSLSLEYGNAPLSAYAYCNYGLILSGILMKVKTGYQFGRLGTELLVQLNATELKAKVYMVFNTFILHWQEHLKTVLPPLMEGYQSGLNAGDIEFAAYCLGIYNNSIFFTGQNLNSAQQEIENYCQKIEQLQQKQALYRVRHLQNIIHQLRGQTTESPGLDGEPYREEILLNLHQQESDRGALGYFYVLKLQYYYWLDSYSEAEIYRLQAEAYLNSIRGGYVSSLFYFYAALIDLGVYTQKTEKQQKLLLKKVNIYQKKMKRWAHHAPMNFLHKYHLVEAERHRILARDRLAADFYDLAIIGAKENGYLQEEAIANERAGQFYLAQKKEAIARTYLQQAYLCYDRWGARAKTQRLLQTYPQFFSAPVREAFLSHIRTTIASTRTGQPTDTLDFASILKASRAIGSEIVLDKLLARMMAIILENAAAQRGILLLDREGTWQIEAEIAIEPEGVEVLQSRPLAEVSPNLLPKSIITYIAHTQKAVVLDRAAEGSEFSRDEYFQHSSPQSLLCMPLLYQGKLIGLLYLEHHSIIGIFSSDRLEVLQLLTAQAAIALENALLYANLSRANATLEDKVRQRTQEIQQKNCHLEQTLTELKQTQAQLIHAEKMSGIGQMVAGVAHEINNPVSFIYSNLDPARRYIQDVFALLELYRQEHSQPSTRIRDTEADIDLEFVEKDLPKLLDSMQNGAKRIATIVKSLRVFSRLDEAEYKTIDLHENLESTLMLLQHRLRKTEEFTAIQVLKKYGIVPQITCYASQLNQVFLSILANSIDALRGSDRNTAAEPPTILITTETITEKTVRITIADNGMGMDESTRQRVFEPFFTTKPVGRGTGLGLSTTYQIIVEHHQGAIACQSRLGKGTEFIIEIPIQS